MGSLAQNPASRYIEIRLQSEHICAPLQTEDYVVQPIIDVSPPKWHLGHTTWFFEHFVLKPFLKNYREFDRNYEFVFNSYYESIGKRVMRTDRGNLSRPPVNDVYRYRRHVDQAMGELLARELPSEARQLLEMGLNHEQQHQELLLTDIKYILGNNPLFPAYDNSMQFENVVEQKKNPVSMQAGIYQIGYGGTGFCFDNELHLHRVFLEDYEIDANLVTYSQFFEFIEDGGYDNFRFWHAEGWDWVNSNKIKSPLYCHNIEKKWHHYTLAGLKPVDVNAPICHVNFYEAAAFASWKGKRLPTEFEWEAASQKFDWGKRWEWTASAYLPYPGYRIAPGAIGEYNGKFMINQMVLRGASVATPKGHSRCTYRNFFSPPLSWQYSGIRLAQ